MTKKAGPDTRWVTTKSVYSKFNFQIGCQCLLQTYLACSKLRIGSRLVEKSRRPLESTIFQIIFEVKDTDVITIYCQGKFHSNFLPKIPLSMARYIVAWADVERITHCFFHMGNKALSGDEATVPGTYHSSSPRSPVVIGDVKRCLRVSKKSTSGSPQLHSSYESSDEDKPRPKAEGRADRYFYDTLMCQEHSKFSPESMKYRQDHSAARSKADYRKYRDVTDTDKNDSEDYSEVVASKNIDSSMAESDNLHDLGAKKRGRRGKFPLAQVVNFMGKTAKRN
ncbi:uncharacterized protein LOC113521942 isoform X2 [Galleria mellonella]|uniref:Uncharacterized protein LOC113521942 isoform X2 n=1 Tax=Galleria mellonella TaxID=7137 RepID=A0A6J3CC77_GALME|nr:uncharacterized protein LOC113521942 isoform X2 [Galleria mellonella]